MNLCGETITKGGKCTVYRIIKNTLGFEKYLTELPVNNRILMTKSRCRKHRLPIEAGCWAQTYGCASIATTSLMNTTICYAVRYSEKSVKKYINVKFWIRPSTIQLEQLLFKQNY